MGDHNQVADNMRQRVEQCRRLAKFINDPEASRILNQMADEGEIDLKKLRAEAAPQQSGK